MDSEVSENWLNCGAERSVISSTKISWRPVPSSTPQVSILGQYCAASSLMMWTMGQSAPSANSQMIQNREGWLIYQLVVLPIRGTSTGSFSTGELD